MISIGGKTADLLTYFQQKCYIFSIWQQKDYMRGRFGAIFINQKSRELHRDNIWAVFSAKWSKRFSIFVKDYLTN